MQGQTFRGCGTDDFAGYRHLHHPDRLQSVWPRSPRCDGSQASRLIVDAPPVAFQPTKEQQSVIDAQKGTVLVLAAVGSGKTSTLCRRIARTVAEGISPRRILALTFTNRAARHLATGLLASFLRQCQRSPSSHLPWSLLPNPQGGIGDGGAVQ